MDCSFLVREGHSRLVLFFSGWGGEECLFSRYRPADADFLLCYDYRSLDFDFRLLEGYREIRLVAWSMGVWSAGIVLQDACLPFSAKIALNGTLRPVDDAYGIPKAVFHGTLERFDAIVLAKFRRRMCGDAANVKRFLSCGSLRQPGELREELAVLAREVAARPIPSLAWTHALVGEGDKIFPPANQQAAWSVQPGTLCSTFGEEHYSEMFFRMAIEGWPEWKFGFRLSPT